MTIDQSEASPGAAAEQYRTPWASRHGGALVASARVLCFAAVAAFLAFAGYKRLFIWFAPWDDEGYMLVSLDSFHGGGRLYDEVYTSYGPFYFESMDAIFRLGGLAITHDHGRLVSLAVWVAVSL